jgi:FdhD protein
MKDNKLQEITACRITLPEIDMVKEQCCAAVEEALTLSIEEVGDITLMCTPVDIDALALGFLFSEGYIISKDEAKLVSSPAESMGSPVMLVTLDNLEEYERGRNLIVTSSCGACGVRSIQSLVASATVERTLVISAERLVALADMMRERQEIFHSTGGTHAAAIFHENGDICSFAEDIGRHNALDKAVGKLLLAGGVSGSCGVMLSGRVSFEMVAKAARAGIELIAAVSAPTSMAIEAAEKCGITLCCFVRQKRLTVFTNPERITDL